MAQIVQPQISKQHPKPRSTLGLVLKIIGIVAGVLIVIFVGIYIGLFYLLGGFGSKNQAKTDFDPIAKQLEPLQAQLLCDNGDSGHSLDNTVPWYSAYYSIPGDNSLDAKLNTIVVNDGFQPADQQNTNYTKGGSKLEATIIHSGGLPLECGVSNYGDLQRVEPGKALVHYQLTEKDTAAP